MTAPTSECGLYGHVIVLGVVLSASQCKHKSHRMTLAGWKNGVALTKMGNNYPLKFTRAWAQILDDTLGSWRQTQVVVVDRHGFSWYCSFDLLMVLAVWIGYDLWCGYPFLGFLDHLAVHVGV